MTLKPTTNHCCRHDFTLSAPATIHDWIEALGEEKCADIIFKMQCYTKANLAIRHALRFDPKNPREFTSNEIALAAERGSKALLTL